MAPSNATETQLTSEMRQALQHVIGEANNTFTSNTVDAGSKRKKRKKHAKGHEDTETRHVEQPQSTASATVDTEAEKRPKKKKRMARDSQVVENTQAVPVEPDAPAMEQLVDSATETASSGKSAKKKKDKGKQKDTVASGNPDLQDEQPTIDPQLTDERDKEAQSRAFINAVIAAAAQQMRGTQETPGEPFQPFPQLPDSLPVPPLQPLTAIYNSLGQPAFPLPGPLFPGINSSEDVIRAVQNLDLSKVVDALKSLSYTAGPSMLNEQDSSQQRVNQPPIIPSLPAFHTVPEPAPQAPVSVPVELGTANQVPVSSNLILGQTPRSDKAPLPKKKLTNAVTMPAVGPDYNLDHARFLANRWVNANKLAELARTKGLVYKKGKFSATEEEAVRIALERYRLSRGMTEQQLTEAIFAKGPKGKDHAFWTEITEQVPQRPIIAVYHYVRRAYHPMKQQGKWMISEDDALQRAVADLGQSWEKVSQRVGRMAADCRDRWRNHLANREQRVTGPWTKEEEEMLTKIVTDLTFAQGKDPDNDIFWGIVAERMGNRRGRQQCRIKWTDALSKTVKNDGFKPRWSHQDAYILVHKIASLNVRDDSEIDWKLLPDDDWNLWSAHSLQRRWLTLKRSVQGWEQMSHQEIVSFLCFKKAQIPPSQPSARKSRVTSARVVPVETNDTAPEPGPSTFKRNRAHGPANPDPESSEDEDMEEIAIQQDQAQAQTETLAEVEEENGSESTTSSSGSSDDDSSDSD